MKTVVSAVTLWQERTRAWYGIDRRRLVLQVLAISWEGLNSINLKVCQISNVRQLRAASSEQPGTCIGNGITAPHVPVRAVSVTAPKCSWNQTGEPNPSRAPRGRGGNGRQELTFVPCWPLTPSWYVSLYVPFGIKCQHFRLFGQ